MPRFLVSILAQFKTANPRLRRANFRLGERDRPGRRGRRLADRILPVLYDSYPSIQTQRER